MPLLQRIQWLNRHGASSALLVLLLLFCALMHYSALAKIEILSPISPASEPRLFRSMVGVQYFDAHWWYALPYLVIFFGTLICLETRNAPRWAVWITFLFLALPFLGYAWACVRIANRLILFDGFLITPR